MKSRTVILYQRVSVVNLASWQRFIPVNVPIEEIRCCTPAGCYVCSKNSGNLRAPSGVLYFPR